jgi:YVTN family beta-propeller protein
MGRGLAAFPLAASIGAVLPPAALSPPNRRSAVRFLAAIAVATIVAVTGGAGPAHAKDAVVLNSDDGSLSLIDTTTYKEISRNYIGRQPHHLIATPDGKSLIVAMAGGNELAFIDKATAAVTARREASDPYQIGFSPDGKWFVANSLRLDRIDIYEGATYQLVHRLPAPTMPSHIAFSTDSNTVYVTLQGTNNLIAIDLATGVPRWTVPVGRQPAGVLVRPAGTILVAIMGSDHIAEVDPGDGKIVRLIRTGAGAHNFLLAPDGKTLYVSNRLAGTISVLDAATLAVTGSLAAPGGPDDMALSVDGKELWATGRWRASVDVIDRESGTLRTTIPVGRSPHGIMLN